MSKNTKIILGIVIAVALIVAVAKIFGGDGDVTEVTIEKAAKRTVIESVTASGKIEPQIEVKIQSEVSGQITELPVKEGDLVKKGDLLVKINPDIYIAALNRADAALNSAKSNLASSRARLAQAEAQLKVQELSFTRNKNLFEQKAISAAEFENATSAVETARAEAQAAKETIKGAEFSIASAEASRNEANDNLRRTTIYAPMDGTVTALTKEMGETVLGNNMMSGDVIMKVSALSTMEVNVEVNESDIVRVQLGDTAVVEVDAYQEVKFKGVVTEIGNTALNALNAALSADQVTNFSVKVAIVKESYASLMENQPANYAPFRPGMSASVEILTSKAVDVLTIPIKAVTSRDDTTSTSLLERLNKDTDEELEKEPFTVVFVMSAGGEAELRVVKTGIQDNRFIEIKEGIKADEEVITGPYEEVARKLNKGAKVKRKVEMAEKEEEK
ncbi:MAG: efflux RND transporter periplasmic adaptor subunit [Flavobacteriales bacterium]